MEDSSEAEQLSAVPECAAHLRTPPPPPDGDSRRCCPVHMVRGRVQHQSRRTDRLLAASPHPPPPFPAAAGKGVLIDRRCWRAAKPPASTPLFLCPRPRRGGGGARGGGIPSKKTPPPSQSHRVCPHPHPSPKRAVRPLGGADGDGTLHNRVLNPVANTRRTLPGIRRSLSAGSARRRLWARLERAPRAPAILLGDGHSARRDVPRGPPPDTTVT